MIEIKLSESRSLQIENQGDDILINGNISGSELLKVGPSSFKVIGDNTIYEVEVIEQAEKKFALSIDNKIVHADVSDHMDQVLEKLGMNTSQNIAVKEVKAPMPGSILDILVTEGATVQANDQLLVLEAMKMENVIKSPGEGIVSKIHVVQKENVEKNQVLISFE